MSRLQRITVLDTSVGTNNLGDEIIVDAVRRHVGALFPNALSFSVGTHDYMGRHSRRIVKTSDLAFASGTNLLTSRMWFRAPWKVGIRDALAINNVVLLGCGWYQYQNFSEPYSKWLLTSVLSKNHIHAVRDDYSRKKLQALGIEKVLNTSCPTLWDITPDHCAALPVEKSREVVTTINTFFKNKDLDRRMLEILSRNYDKVHLWIQTDNDWDYAKGLMEGMEFVAPSLAAFDSLLETHPSLDYAGNRLHGGIRALQKGRRSIIVEVDNRAAEMGRDFDLPTVARDDFDRFEAMITGPLPISVKPPQDRISEWKAQFQS